MEIFKLQRPIATNSEVLEVLAYNKKRTIQGQFPMNDTLEMLFDDKYKIYVEGKFNDDTGNIEIVKVVNEQDW
jgi:hypothetical protein